MKVNLTIDMNPEKIADLTDQLPQKEFSRVLKLIDTKSRVRFKHAMLSARKEFKRSGLTRKDVELTLAEIRGTKK